MAITSASQTCEKLEETSALGLYGSLLGRACDRDGLLASVAEGVEAKRALAEIERTRTEVDRRILRDLHARSARGAVAAETIAGKGLPDEEAVNSTADALALMVQIGSAPSDGGDGDPYKGEIRDIGRVPAPVRAEIAGAARERLTKIGADVIQGAAHKGGKGFCLEGGDARQCAAEAFIEAVGDYDPSRGHFLPFAWKIAEFACLKAGTDARPVKTGKAREKLVRDVLRAEDALAQYDDGKGGKHGRPSDREVAAYLDNRVSPKDVRSCRAGIVVESLDMPARFDDDARSPIDLLSYPGADFDEVEAAAEACERIARGMARIREAAPSAGLTDDEREWLRSDLGFDCETGRMLHRTSPAKVGASRSTRESAARKIRRALCA